MPMACRCAGSKPMGASTFSRLFESRLVPSVTELDNRGQCAEDGNERESHCQHPMMGGKDQYKAAIFYQCREARNAKWDDEQAKGRPGFQPHSHLPRPRRVDEQRHADDRAEPD